MKMIKVFKTALVTGLFTAMVLAGGNLLASGCSAHAKMCNASCSLSDPPGGSTLCKSGLSWAVCTSYDANGNVVTVQQDTCYWRP